MDLTSVIIGLAILVVLIALGVHMGVSLAIAGAVGLVFASGPEQSMSLVTNSLYYVGEKWTYVAVPLFIFMGLLSSGGISNNLYEGLNILMGRIRAGLGIATIAACTAFGTVCGSSLVTASVFAQVSAPQMRKYGYSKTLAYGLCASAGMIGILIPPSIFAVVYALLTQESVGRLLLAGIGPGLLMAVVFSIGVWLIGKFRPGEVGTPPPVTVTRRQRVGTARLFWPSAVVALILIGGIFGGVFTPTEAGAFASLAVLIIVVATAGKGRWKQVRKGMIDTASTSAMIFLILGGASIFSRFLVLSGLVSAVTQAILGLNL